MNDPATFCNPVNISYQYRKGYRSRESADPCVISHGGEYWLFASNASGYWYSSNLVDWSFVYCDLPELDKYAPAVCVIGDTFYLTHTDNGSIFKTKDPKSAKWEYAGHPVDWQDPAFLIDDDGSVYCYYGCSDVEPIRAVKLDPDNDLALLEGPVDLFNSDGVNHGFEIPGDSNDLYGAPCWLEAPWATKYNGKYYIQYAAPGTEFASYADGCYVSDAPFGTYTYAENSPIAYKSTGFMLSAGHGSMVMDDKGRWWRFDTASISVNHKFERRIVMLPCKFQGGLLVTNTVFADYPMYRPDNPEFDFDTPNPPWNLVSYGARADASSCLDGHEPSNAFDGSMRSWWSAQTGGAGEWLRADLGKVCAVNAIHVNFADQDAADTHDRDNGYVYRYLLEVSENGADWHTVADESEAEAKPFMAMDFSHGYFELERERSVRYVRITNKGDVPAKGKFAVSGLRLFGSGGGEPPSEVQDFTITRSDSGLSAELSWTPSQHAQGYIIRFGVRPDALYTHYQVIGGDRVSVTILNKDAGYYFTVDAYNDSGVTRGLDVKFCPPDRI